MTQIKQKQGGTELQDGGEDGGRRELMLQRMTLKT